MRSWNSILGGMRPGDGLALLVLLLGLVISSAVQAQNLVLNGSFESGVDPGSSTLLPSGSTAVDGWGIVFDATYVGSAWEASEGNRSLSLGNPANSNQAGNGYISQDFPTQAGVRYRLQFDLAGDINDPPSVRTLRVAIRPVTGGQGFTVQQDFTFDSTGASAASMGWQTVTVDFTAESDSTRLEFVTPLASFPPRPALDNVSIVALAAPPVPTGNTYDYDALDRVTRVKYPNGSFVDYTYDAAGNILTRTVPEPGLGSMMIAGLLGLASLGRRRQRRRREGDTLDGRGERMRRSGAVSITLVALALPSPSFAQALAAPAARPDWHETVREQIADAEYEVSWQRAGLRRQVEAWQAPNRAHNFRTHFLDEGIRVTPRVTGEAAGDAWELGLSLESYGRGGAANVTEAGTPRTDGARVTYHRGEIVEWFVNDRRGLEQGFTLRSPPRTSRGQRAQGRGARSSVGSPATSAAYVALRVEGDARPVLASDRQSVSFVRAGSPLAIAHYSHLVVVDADGQELDAWMEVDSDEAGHLIRLVFEDSEAAYPVEIDPLLTTPAWSVTGNQSEAGLGFSVAGAGDVNGDGFDDVLVGAPFFDEGGNENTGRAYLYLGGPGGLSNTPAWFAQGEFPFGVRNPGSRDARFGYALSGGGDVNNDGYDDILISRAPGIFSQGITIPGQAYLYLGSPVGPGQTADWILQGRDARRLGQSIAIVGDRDEDQDGILENDFNGDEYADIVIGEPGGIQTEGQGRVYVFYGQADAALGGGTFCQGQPDGNHTVICSGGILATDPPTVWVNSFADDDEFGERVAGAGDVNCDGFGDLAVGQPRFASNDRGRVQIYQGSTAGVVPTPVFELWGDASGIGTGGAEEFGRSIASAGRIDRFVEPGPGQACDDVLVGAPGRDVPGSNAAGAVFVIRGVASPGLGEPFPLEYYGPILKGSLAGERLGQSVARVGDVNGDMADDFLLGAPGGGNNEGRAYLVLGPTGTDYLIPGNGGTDTDNFVWRVDGAGAGDYLGNSVAGADVNDDGLADLVVGSASAIGGLSPIAGTLPTAPGQAFTYLGSAPVPFTDLMGLPAGDFEDAYAWIGPVGSIDSSNDSSPAVSSGSSPGSILISTGLAQDEATGATDWDGDGQPDRTTAAMVVAVPPGAGRQTLRFTTQYLASDPSETPRALASIRYKYFRAGEQKDANDIDTSFILETPIDEAGRGAKHSPMSHAIEIPDPNDDAVTHIGLEIQVTERTAPAGDSAIALSNIFFSDLELPDYLSDSFLPAQDSNADSRVDYVPNPQPSDVSASAGPFRYDINLMNIPGRLQPFELRLSYDSQRTREEQLGPKWSHSFASTITESVEDINPADGCPDSVFVRLGAGQLEVFQGRPNPNPGIACLFEPRYPGVYSTLEKLPFDGTYVHRTKDNFESNFTPPTVGTSEFRQLLRAHPNQEQRIVWIYDDPTGPVDLVRDTRGEDFLFDYDESFTPPRLVSVSGSAAQVRFEYSELGFLESVIDANGLETAFSYDAAGNLLTITDADGTRLVSNEYESFAGLGFNQESNRVVRQLNANPNDLGRQTTYAGDALETSDRENGLRLDRYDVFSRVVESRQLLNSSVSTSLDTCTRGDTWCAVWNYVYNADNLVVSQTDPRGFVTDTVYDDSGNQICQTVDANDDPDPIRMRTGALYDARNNLIAELVARAESVESALPACPLPGDTVVSQPGEWFVTSFVYDPLLDYLESSTDPSGRTTTFAYQEEDGTDDEGLLQSVTNAEGETRSIEYDSLGYPKTITNEAGEATQNTTNLMGRRTSTTDPLGNTRRANYDAGGRLVSTVDPPLGFQSNTGEVFTYDAQGRQLTRTDADGNVWTRSYTPTGQLEAETDPLGNAIRYGYDLEDRLVSTIDARGFETSRAYDALGRLTEITNPLGDEYVYSFAYDKSGNILSETGPQVDPAFPSTTTFMYDALGRVTSEADALDAQGNETIFTYDSRGQVLSREEPQHPVLGARIWSASYTDTGQIATTSDPEGVSTTFTYDAMNRVDTETQDQLGRNTDFDYDAVGRLTQVTVTVGGALLTSAEAVYDAAGNNTAVTDPADPNRNVIEYDYDALNRIIRERDGLGFQIEIDYEERGLVAARANARGEVISFEYDAAGQLATTSTLDVTGSWTITETLDASGNSTDSIVDTNAAVSVHRSFDGLDRLTSRRLDLPTTPTPTSPSTASEYDEAGNLSKVIYSDGKEVLYEYDALSRLKSVTDWDANVTSYAYDEVGNVIGITRPDGSTVDYEYDRAGAVLSIQDTNPSLGDPIIFDASFQVDAAGRRINATFDLPLDPDPTLDPDATFTYDAANRLVGRNADVFQYDFDGNLTSGTLGGSPRTLAYNALNQLVDIDSGAEVIRYDADGRRASRQVGSATTYYVYDTEGRQIEELDESGAVIARYVHGLGLISRQDGGSGAVSVYHFDSRGSTLALTDLGTGAITDAYAYTPYGGVQRDPTNSTPNPFTYNGRDGVVDDGNGLYYMLARYYAPELMRFVQKDPVYEGEINRPLTLNRYAFVEGNPIEKIDPTGEFGILGAIVGAATGAVTGIVVAAVTGDDILDAALEGAAAGAIIGATGGVGAIGAAIGGGVSLASGGSFSDVALGASVGAVSSLGLGSAVGAAFLGGAIGAGGSIENRLAAGGIDAAGALVLGGVGKVGGKAFAKTGIGKSIARSGLAKSAVKTSPGKLLLPVTKGTRQASLNALRSAGRPLGRSGRRLGIRISRESIGIAEETVNILYEDTARGVGVFLGKQLARNPEAISRATAAVVYLR